MSKKKRTIIGRVFLGLLILSLLVYAFFSIPACEKLLYPYPNQKIVEKYAAQYGVDPLLVVSIIREESKFLPQSQSHKGAIGLMQLMPTTAESIAHSIGDKGYNQEQLLNPDKNIQYGTWYLASLKKVFANNLILVIAAYNGGRGHVQEWLNSGQIDRAHISPEDIPFPETKDYVARVLKSYQKYIKLYRT